MAVTSICLLVRHAISNSNSDVGSSSLYVVTFIGDLVTDFLKQLRLLPVSLIHSKVEQGCITNGLKVDQKLTNSVPAVLPKIGLKKLLIPTHY